jgi:hypothetical protein
VISWIEPAAPVNLLYRFERRFGPAEAMVLGKALAAASAGSRLTLDFSDVRDFDDVAVGVLAHALASSCRAAVALHGLSLHQERMLGYLGVDLERYAVAPPSKA